MDSSKQTKTNFLSSHQLSCCRSACRTHRNSSDRNALPSTTYWTWQSKQAEDSRNYFNLFSSCVVGCIHVFSGTHFSGTGVRFDLATSPSSNKLSIKIYIFSVIIVWLIEIILGVFSSRAVYGIFFEMAHYVAVYSVIIVLSLVTICVSYIAIRTRLNHKVPSIDAAQNRRDTHCTQIAKIAKNSEN